MAITLNTESIPKTAFSGAPYIISGTSNCKNQPNSNHHRVVLKVNIYDEILDSSSPLVLLDNRTFVYVLGESDSDGVSSFDFDVSEYLHSYIRKTREIKYDTSSLYKKEPYTQNKILRVDFRLHEAYTVDGNLIETQDVVYPSDTDKRLKPSVIEGILTDYDRYKHPEWYDISSMSGVGGALSLVTKPLSGNIGFLLERKKEIYISNNKYSNYNEFYDKIGYNTNTHTGITTYVSNTLVGTRLIFLNRFGVLESAVAIANESRTIKTKQNVMVGMKSNTFTGQRTLYSRATPGETEIELSSGPVNEEWAEWWVTDVLRSERAWLYDEKRNYWMEGVIVPAEKHTIIDRAKSQASVVPFTFRCTMQS